MIKRKKTNNDLQITTHKNHILRTKNHIKNGVNDNMHG
jgi:hypothetical protein